MPVSPASTLPDELLSIVIDYTELDDVVRLCRLCQQWRRVARAHPTFWKDIRLGGLTKGGPAFFAARLSSTKNVGVRVSVYLTGCDRFVHTAARKLVLEAVTASLARIAYLHLDFGPELAAEALSALSNPAPCLKRLALGAVCLEGASRVPRSLLAGDGPLLADVRLAGLTLPLQPSDAFSHVRRLQYTVTEHASLSMNIFEHFPALKVLDIYSTGTYNTNEFIAQFRRAPELEALDIVSDNDDLHALFAACPRLLSIPTIHFTYNRDALELLARRLPPGPLALKLAASTDIIFTVSSHSRGWCRTCRITPADRPQRAYLPEPGFYACKEIGHRITTLELDVGPGAACYRIASLIGALPACEMLEISVDCFLHAFEYHRGDPIPLPSLTKVVIRPRGGKMSVAVRAKMLAWFLRDLIGRQTPRLPLELAGVSLEGDYTPLEADYIFLADVLL